MRSRKKRYGSGCLRAFWEVCKALPFFINSSAMKYFEICVWVPAHEADAFMNVRAELL